MRSRDLQAGRKERKEKEDVVTMSGTPLTSHRFDCSFIKSRGEEGMDFGIKPADT